MRRFGQRWIEELRKAGWFFWPSLVLLLMLAGLFYWQPDITYALTVYSPWAPGLVGYFITILAAIRRRSMAMLFLALAWIGWGAFGSDDVVAFFRRTSGEAELGSFRSAGKLTIVSYNCSRGTLDAAKKARHLAPDIVLLQETPSANELKVLAKEMWGPKAGLLAGPDCTILSRFPLKVLSKESNHVAAEVETSSGKVVVVSLRLQPPVLRFDYWRPECWQSYAEDRGRRREELRQLVATLPKRTPMIVGGDFNAPPDRMVTGVLAPLGLSETAGTVGSGWIATAVEAFPMIRIDHIWVSKDFTPLRSIARGYSISDHRMVVLDIAR